MSNLIYDGDYIMTLSNVNLPSNIAWTSPGVFTGNGKIGMYVSLSNIGTTRSLTSGNAQFNNIGKYINNTIDAFHVCDISLGSATYASNMSVEWQHQTLDMSIGAAETFYQISSNNDIFANVKSTITPLRQYPYCTFQTITFSVPANQNYVDIYHTIRAPSSGLTSLEYNNNTVFNESISSDQGIYMLTGTGFNQTHKCQVTCASSYLFPGTMSNMVKPIGFNIMNDKSASFQKLRFLNILGNTEYTFHILSSSMTSYDFVETTEEVKRIIMNIMFKEPTQTSLVSRILADNNVMWERMWEADVQINPKININESQYEGVQSVRRFTRQCLFNIFSCLREAVNTEINPLNLSFLDSDGNLFFDGDLWLMPFLIMTKPNIAKVMLENKYKLLEQAMQLSASFGYTGSKFPYKNDVMGYKNVYWDVISPLHIFNNASIAVNIWNYFRVTQDLAWLQSKGYPMMRSIIEFFVSYVKIVENVYTVENILGLGQTICDDHAFTINLILLAMVYIIQVSNRLSYTTDPVWTDILHRLRIPIETIGINSGVIRYFNTYDGLTQVDILDNLVVMMPLFNQLYFNSTSSRNASDVNKNLLYYIPRLLPAFESHPLNNLFILGSYGFLSQSSTSYISTFSTYVTKVLNENVVGLWGYMNSKNDEKQGNDVTLNALFLLIIMTCICGVRIKGSTNPSNVQIESYGLEVSSQGQGVYMPSTWRSVRLLMTTGFAEVYNSYVVS